MARKELRGVSSDYSVFKWICLLSLAWTLALIVLTILFIDDAHDMSMALAVASLFFVAIGLCHTVPSVICISTNKKRPRENAVVHIHNKMDTNHILRLDSPYACGGCGSSFRGYNAAFCPECGSRDITASQDCVREKYVFMTRYMQIVTGSMMAALGLMIFVCCVYVPEEPLIGLIFAFVFGPTYVFAGMIEYVTKNYGDDGKNIVPLCASFARGGGMLYTIIPLKDFQCPYCGSSHGAWGNRYCTQCGKPVEHRTDD